jgi:hypothetical protein
MGDTWKWSWEQYRQCLCPSIQQACHCKLVRHFILQLPILFLYSLCRGFWTNHQVLNKMQKPIVVAIALVYTQCVYKPFGGLLW